MNPPLPSLPSPDITELPRLGPPEIRVHINVQVQHTPKDETIAQSPFSPQVSHNSHKSHTSTAVAMRDYLRARRIWQPFGDKFALNDEVSRQVRRDTLRFRIEQKHWMGIL